MQTPPPCTAMPSRRLSLLAAVASVACAACSSLSPTGVPISPPAIHPEAQLDLPKAGTPDTRINPAAIPLRKYLAALAAAEQAETPTAAQLRRYADAGVALVQVQCLRWFTSLSDRQLTKDYQDGNFNIIRQLGTAVLGIGGANSTIVSLYGAGNTAYEGLSNNFESSFLVAPNGKKVKQQVMHLLEDQEQAIYDSSSAERATLLTVYRRLERYADLCTHATAREIVNTALDQATAKVSATGQLEVQPSVSAQALAEFKTKADLANRQAEADKAAMQAKVDRAEKARDATVEAAKQREADKDAQIQRLTEALAKQQSAAATAMPPAAAASR